MVTLQIQAEHWKADVLSSDGENINDEWIHVEARVTADSIDFAKRGIEWVLNAFAFGRDAAIRVEETDTHYRLESGEKHPIHLGYVRFGYRLRWATEWKRVVPDYNSVRVIGAAEVKTDV